jgi:hypothetical protein
LFPVSAATLEEHYDSESEYAERREVPRPLEQILLAIIQYGSRDEIAQTPQPLILTCRDDDCFGLADDALKIVMRGADKEDKVAE